MSGHPALYERARRVTPGGVHSPVRAFRSVGGTPVFFAKGTGARLIDVDGREYIDFCGSFGPLILGHADPEVAQVAHQAINDGWSFGACEPYSLDLAEWITSRLPWVERIRFVSSGTEAVMSALRIARAATGRSRVLKFEGCYHGHTDAMLVRAGSGLALSDPRRGESKGEHNVAASSDGVPDGILGDTLVAPLDDDDALRRMFEQNGGAIAAAIVEPLPANFGLLPQREEWLHTLAALCREHGALLILDEVISGFRVGRGGMAEALTIVPDLVCYGKVIGGGFPVAAYAGRADLMSLVAPDGPVYQAGTLSANPVGMRAGLATLARMDAAERMASAGGSRPPASRVNLPTTSQHAARESTSSTPRRSSGCDVPRRARCDRSRLYRRARASGISVSFTRRSTAVSIFRRPVSRCASCRSRTNAGSWTKRAPHWSKPPGRRRDQ